MPFRKPFRSYLLAFCPSVALALLLSACTTRVISVHTPDLTGPAQNVSDYKPGESRVVVLSDNTPIQVQRTGDQLLYRLEGTFTRDTFTQIQQNIALKPKSERQEILKKEVDSVFESAKKIGAIARTSIPEAGYFQFMLPYEQQLSHSLKKLKLSERQITIEPIAYRKSATQKMPSKENSFLSGLERIGAIEFVKQAENDIGGGIKVDGSSVQIGFADSGISYNHPTFLSRKTGNPRINYIQDLTGEGTVFINPIAKFSARAVKNGSDEDLIINAEYIDTPKLPSTPVADDFKEIENLKIKVNPEQRALLLAPNASGAKIGVIVESRLNSDDVAVDINANGEKNDLLYVLYLPATESLPERVYFDSTGTADFRSSIPLSDFNTFKENTFKNTMPVFAERIGFAFRDVKLSNKEGRSSTNVRAIALVGLDLDVHGTHVAGIAAGSKMLSNDSPDTLARGVAPEARIAMVRVCAVNDGCGVNEGIANLVVNAGAEVVNASIGELSRANDGFGVGEVLINRLVSTKNVAFIVSAGNDGPGRQTVNSPSVARLALSVGATATRAMIDRQYQWAAGGTSPLTDSPRADLNEDFVFDFSSRGPTASGGLKPDIMAPGTELSSVQLNATPGTLGGLDMDWGTSMAAPTAAGAYALLLDAIKKYNERHPQTQLTTDASTLRRVLMESARPFDATRFDLSSGEKSQGQYTWADQGTGMIQLTSAWKKLFELRDSNPPTAVTLGDRSVELDYEVITLGKAPNGDHYDGSKIKNGSPAFGSGIYLNVDDGTRFKSVYISRKLPEFFAGTESAGDLTRQLLTTEDRFALRTVIYGSSESWLKAGVQETADCASSPTSELSIIGQGIAVGVSNGKGTYNALAASTLNICFDREKIAALPPGDHGALIYAYRKVGSQISPVASFIVPVFVSVPRHAIAQGSGFEHEGQIAAFGLDRNYLQVPPGTSALRITLSVPPIKTDRRGNIPPEETCSGVELMATEGLNTENAIKNSSDARVSNCDLSSKIPTAAPILDPKKRELVFTRANPRPGLWDVHVFGQHRYPLSRYKLKVDYITGEPSVQQIQGDAGALNGTLHWNLKESSFAAVPDSKTSSYELTNLVAETHSQVIENGFVFVESPLGKLRTYPETIKSVTITIGQSPGNDLDLYVFACPADAQDASDSRCAPEGKSIGVSDEEQVTFVPKPGTQYAVRVEGTSIDDEGRFVSTEKLSVTPEKGQVEISGAASEYEIRYSFAPESSAILKDALFSEGKYQATGTLSIRMADQTILSTLPVKIEKAAVAR